MSIRILVAYATKYGSTREIAEALGKGLRENGVEAAVQAAKAVKTIDEYEGIVIAAPFYFGAMLKDAKKFIERFKAELQDNAVALLGCGPLSADEAMADARAQLNQALAAMPWLKPAATAMFVGSYDPGRLRLGDKIIALLPASPLHGVGKRDERDWEAIRTWAKKLPAALSLL